MQTTAQHAGSMRPRISRRRRNVGATDRVISGTLGAVSLMTLGKRTSLAGKALVAASGALLLTRAATGHSMAYEAAGISSASLRQGAGIDIDSTTTIGVPRQVVYEYWRDLTNLPLVMHHLDSVEVRADGVSHWKARGPSDMPVEWDARIIHDEPGAYLAWESLPGSDIQHAGSVHFMDAGDGGTELHLNLRYVPKGNQVGFAIAKMLNPITQADVDEDLMRFKHTMEASVDITAGV